MVVGEVTSAVAGTFHLPIYNIFINGYIGDRNIFNRN